MVVLGFGVSRGGVDSTGEQLLDSDSTLRALERNGLVSRTLTPEVPVRTDYALTP